MADIEDYEKEWNLPEEEEKESNTTMIAVGAVVGILLTIGICYALKCFEPKVETKVVNKTTVKTEYKLSDKIIDECGSNFNWVVIPDQKHTKSAEETKDDNDKTSNKEKDTKDKKNTFEIQEEDKKQIQQIIENIHGHDLEELIKGEWQCIRFNHHSDFLATFTHWLGEHDKDKHYTDVTKTNLLKIVGKERVGEEKPQIVKFEFNNNKKHVESLSFKSNKHSWKIEKELELNVLVEFKEKN